MKRRDFLKTSAPALAIPFMLGGMPIRALARSPIGDSIAGITADTDKVLVLIQLQGGNDGINTIVPLDQYSLYSSLRPQVALPESKVLKLTNATGMHPAMKELQAMYAGGMMNIVQGVTYPNPNQSHFRSTDIWMSGVDYNQYLNTGWMGRYLDVEYPNYPEGYPNATMPDPPAIQMGAVMSLALQGPQQSMGIAITDPTTFYNLVNGTSKGPFADPPDTRPGNELRFLRQIEAESQLYSASIKSAADKAPNKATYPTGNTLADQLKIVARLIAGGLKTRVYMVTLGGFDTHSGQVDTADTTAGTHATLLGRLSSGVKAFYDDLALLGAQDRVLTMSFSEFGRRVQSNASAGTDHGTAAPMLVVGTKVNPVIIGKNPDLTTLDNGGNLLLQHDFRQVYASVLTQWFGVTGAELQTSMLKDFTQVPIIKQSSTSVEQLDYSSSGALAVQLAPNPVSAAAHVGFELPEPADVSLRIRDLDGRICRELLNARSEAGPQSVSFHRESLPAGTYFVDLRAGRRHAVVKMVVQ
ncbi:MAG: DUF1501 domain-containing protein [Candidatus Kapaibacterium sp.]